MCAAVGTGAGALAATPIHRLAVPTGVVPRACCPHCGRPMAAGWRGWVSVSSRCPACRLAAHTRSWAYPVVGAVAYAGLGARTPLRGAAADMLLFGAWLVLAAAGLVLAGIDVYVHRLPRPIVGATAILVAGLVTIAVIVGHDGWLLGHALVAAGLFALGYLVLALAGPGLVGAGDIYLAGLLGLLLGAGPLRQILAGAVLPYLLGASVVLLGASVVAVRLVAGRLDRRDQVALGPYLLAGAVLAKILFP